MTIMTMPSAHKMTWGAQGTRPGLCRNEGLISLKGLSKPCDFKAPFSVPPLEVSGKVLWPTVQVESGGTGSAPDSL